MTTWHLTRAWFEPANWRSTNSANEPLAVSLCCQYLCPRGASQKSFNHILPEGVIYSWRLVYGLTTSEWRPPEQRYWRNRETANIGLVSSVGRAPARQSRGRRFKSRSSFYCSSKMYLKCTQSVSPVLYYMIYLYLLIGTIIVVTILSWRRSPEDEYTGTVKTSSFSPLLLRTKNYNS